MKKTTMALILVLAMTLGAATAALAAAPTTDGSIRFKPDGVIIVTPPEPKDPLDPNSPCCDCFGKPPENDCDCSCHDYFDPEDGKAFKEFNMGGNLYFGEWIIGAYGQYNSNDQVQTTAFGTHTGLQIVNRTENPAIIEVSVTEFIYKEGSNPVLKGADLTLVALAKEASNGYDKKDVTQASNITLVPGKNGMTGDGINILTTLAGSKVKASWYGLLDVDPGTANWAGTAQAVLTWTDASGTPG